MKTVKKMMPETIITESELRPGVTVGQKTRNRVSFAVVDEQGQIVRFDSNNQPEVYQQRHIAQRVADWYNNQHSASPESSASVADHPGSGKSSPTS